MTGDWLGPFCALMSSATWAMGSAAYTRLSISYSAASVNLTRAVVAAPLFLLAWIVLEEGARSPLRTLFEVDSWTWLWLLLSIISSYGLGDVIFLGAARRVGVLTALAIASAYPIWTGLIGFFFLGEVMSVAKSLGVILTVMGIITVIIVQPGGITQVGKEGPNSPTTPSKATWTSGYSLGLVLAGLTSLFWTLNSYSISKVSHSLPPFFSNFLRMALSIPACFLGAMMSAHGHRRRLWIRRKAFKANWVAIVMESFGGSAFFVYGMGHSSLAVGATLSSLAPVLVVPIAWLLGLEKISILRLLGVIAVVLGISMLLS